MMRLLNYEEYIHLPEYKKLIKLEKGIAYHHAGMATVFREMIEILFSKGHIKFLFATKHFQLYWLCLQSVALHLEKLSNKGFRFICHMNTQMAGRAGIDIDTKGYVFHLTNFLYSIVNHLYNYERNIFPNQQ